MQLNFLKKILLVLFLQMIVFNVEAQFFPLPEKVLDSAEFLITYKLTWKEDTNHLELFKEEDLILLVGKEISMFLAYNKYKSIVYGRRIEKEGRVKEYVASGEYRNYLSRFKSTIYKNYPVGKITYTEKVIPTYFKYEEPLNLFQWQLSDLRDTIDGYTVYNAFAEYGGRHWNAWYAPDIPINDGPYKFRGLPGLILKIYDDKQHYSFDLVSIERLKEPLPIEFMKQDWVQTTRGDFLKAKENFKQDIIKNAKDAGANNESQQKALRSMQKKNNPIEF
jgi:GLPGLI family protein